MRWLLWGSWSICLVLVVWAGWWFAQAMLYAGTEPFSAAHDPERLIVGYELVHLPWQALFAVALAWLMRPPHSARKAAPAKGPSPEEASPVHSAQ
jgi:hypothetical protein